MPTTNDQSMNPNAKSLNQDTKIIDNNTAPVDNTEDNLNFDINLDEATSVNVVNEVDINKEIEKAKEEVKEDDLSLDLPDSYFSEEKEEKIIEPEVNKETIVENTNTTNDAWLQNQDQRNKEEEASLFAVASNNKSVAIDINAEVKSENIQTTDTKEDSFKIIPTINIDVNQAKKNEFDIEKSNYTSDMKIIEGLDGINHINDNTGSILDGSVSQVNNEVVESKNIDLDSLIASEGEGINKNEVNVVQSSNPNVPSNDMYPIMSEQTSNNIKPETNDVTDGITNKNPIDINSTVNVISGVSFSEGGDNKPKESHLWKFLVPAGVIAVLGVLGYFVVTTMYPMETQNIVENSVPQVADNIIEQTGLQELTGIQELTGQETNIDSGNIIGETGIVAEIPTVEEGHGASPAIDSLGELTQDMSSQNQIQGQSDIEKLKSFSDEANMFLTEGQSNNNKIYIKYGGTISKKCSELISALENNKEIDNLSGNLAQLEGYLQKLRDIKNAESSQSSGLLQETGSQSGQTVSE